MRSIINNELKCLVCGLTLPEKYLHKHNIFYGNNRENLSKEYGCWCYLCPRHHVMSSAGVHYNAELDQKLKAHTQKRFTEVYPELDFEQIFGENTIRRGRA